MRSTLYCDRVRPCRSQTASTTSWIVLAATATLSSASCWELVKRACLSRRLRACVIYSVIARNERVVTLVCRRRSCQVDLNRGCLAGGGPEAARRPIWRPQPLQYLHVV